MIYVKLWFAAFTCTDCYGLQCLKFIPRLLRGRVSANTVTPYINYVPIGTEVVSAAQVEERAEIVAFVDIRL